MKLTKEHGVTTFSLIAGASVCAAISFCLPATSQDWKPGDPVTFGAAHRSPFDSSSTAGAPGSSRIMKPINGASGSAPQAMPAASSVNMGAPATANPAMNGVPDNFLNSRSIEWKPGDPIPFGTHRPYSPPDNRSSSAPASAVQAAVQAAPMQSTTASIGGNSAPLQDLAPNPATPGFGGFPAGSQSAPAAGFQQSDPTANATQKAAKPKNKPKIKPPHSQRTASASPASAASDTTNSPQTNDNGNVDNGGSGNFFSHAMHWMEGLFGSKK